MSKNNYNFSIVITTLLISLLGLFTILSTEIAKDSLLSWDNIFTKQLVFVVIGIVIFFLISRFDHTFLEYKPVIYSIYIITFVLLLLTAFFGQEVNGARRWFSIFGIQLQPSEFAKITVILTTAYIFNLENTWGEWKRLVISFLALLPIVFLIYIEPHGSMSLIIVIIWFITSFIAMGNQLRNMLLIITFSLIFIGLFLFTAFSQIPYLILNLLGLIIGILMFFARDNWRLPIIITIIIGMLIGGVGSVLWNNVLGDYQRERITTFTNPEGTQSNSGFNVLQAKIAIGSGGIWGKGFANGSQTKLSILPFYQTDFIFSSYIEEFGLIGGFILLSLFFILLWNIFLWPLNHPNNYFENIIIVSIGFKIFIELLINLGTNLGLTPATGIPLPLFSAGGTITIMTFFSIALIQGIINNIKTSQSYISND